jgi:hypothetical protein
MHDAPPLPEYLRSSITEMYGQVASFLFLNKVKENKALLSN